MADVCFEQAYVNAFSQIVQRTISGNYTIPSGITEIGESAFYECSGLTGVTIPSGITYIGGDAFFNCTGLTSVTIPNSVLTIARDAFNNCYSMTSVTIGDSVRTIGSGAFLGCSGLTSITVNATTPPTLLGSTVFASTNDCPIYVPAESVDAYKAASYWKQLKTRIQAIPNS